MMQYDRKILNSLLDSYEGSRLFTGENKVNIRIDFPFNKKLIPAYFDESSYEYERIHSAMRELEEQGYIRIMWKRGRENHIISKVILNPEKIDQVYKYVNRTPKTDLVALNIALLKKCRGSYDTPVCRKFITYLLGRLQKNQSVKEYMELADTEKTKQLLLGISEIEKNVRQCYLREFSIEVFHDSKALQNMSGRLGKVFRKFGEDSGEKDFAEILAEYGIYHTPNYVYLKGRVSFRIHETVYDIADLRQGIGISGEDLPELAFCDVGTVKRVITIENLTTFFRWEEPDALMIYLGGYHNSVRRMLLKSVYQSLPDATYYHFGDIDAGGFEIYRDLCAKTGMPFRRYRMDSDTLKTYEKYGRELTENDRIRLSRMLAEYDGVNVESDGETVKCDGRTAEQNPEKTKIAEVIRYMLERNVKLEQECVVVGSGRS